MGRLFSPSEELTILHQSEDFVVIHKPWGMRSAPGRPENTHDSAELRLRHLIPNAEGPMSVHRLDMETSGLMVFALNAPTQSNLSKQFQKRLVGKRYIALVERAPAELQGAVEAPLIKDPEPTRWPRQKICHDSGRPSRTIWRVNDRPIETPLQHEGRTVRLELQPETGRTHQIRVHLASPPSEGGLGTPILGDTLYGSESTAPRLCLHAETLAFLRPNTDEWVKFESPAPF